MILVYCLLCLGHTLSSGLAILKLWTWFMVPLGLPAIALYHAIGLDMLFAAFKGINTSSQARRLTARSCSSIHLVLR